MEFRQLWSGSEPVKIKICSQTIEDNNDFGISLILLTSYKNNISIDLEGWKNNSMGRDCEGVQDMDNWS